MFVRNEGKDEVFYDMFAILFLVHWRNNLSWVDVNVHILRIGRDVVGMWTRDVVGDFTICHWSELGLFPEVGGGGFSMTSDWDAKPLGLAPPFELETCAGKR